MKMKVLEPRYNMVWLEVSNEAQKSLAEDDPPSAKDALLMGYISVRYRMV